MQSFSYTHAPANVCAITLIQLSGLVTVNVIPQGSVVFHLYANEYTYTRIYIFTCTHASVSVHRELCRKYAKPVVSSHKNCYNQNSAEYVLKLWSV